MGKPFKLDPGNERVTKEVRQQMVDEMMYRLATLLPRITSYNVCYTKLLRKLESLIDGNSLNMVQIEKLQGIYQTVNRLTRLNKDLLLLTKVENNQFVANESISINAIIRDRISDWYEIVELKNFELHWIESDEIWARINPFLAETAVSNLFSNAINHRNNFV